MKKLLFLLTLSVALFSCETESFNEENFSPENNPTEESKPIEENIPTEETPDIAPGKIIDTYIETDGGLN